MTQIVQYREMEDHITQIFHDQGNDAGPVISAYLTQTLSSLSPEDRMAVLDNLIQCFDTLPGKEKKPVALSIDDHVLARVIKLLLGRDIAQIELTSEELLESLAESINTVFERLNQLISVINTTLMGKQEKDQTIRQVIGYHLEGGSQAKSLETYIGQIGKAFFASHEASKKAAHAKVLQILEELSPDKIEKEAEVSRFSPLRTARYYEAYELKFRKFEKWFSSGRFMESFLREFERNCQKISL